MMMDNKFTIRHLICHSGAFLSFNSPCVGLILSCTENDKLIAHSLIRHAIFKSENSSHENICDDKNEFEMLKIVHQTS